MRVMLDGDVLDFDQGDISWMDRAICHGLDQKIFFPGKGKPATRAREICGRCPVKNECLDYAIQSPNNFQGIWGGRTVREREIIKRTRAINGG